MTTLFEVADEMDRQVKLFGVQDHLPSIVPNYNYGILPEHQAKEVCDRRKEASSLSWVDILIEEVAEVVAAAFQGSDLQVREELIQVAAVAMSWVECLDRATRRHQTERS